MIRRVRPLRAPASRALSMVLNRPRGSAVSQVDTRLKARTKLMLDCDTGLDDAIAIALAALSPDTQLLAVGTVAGNVDINHVTKNSLRTVAVLHKERPALELPLIAKGAAACLRVPSEPPKLSHSAEDVFGSDGLGDLPDSFYPPLPWHLLDKRPAWDVMAALAEQHPHELTIVATGPATNVGLAIEKHVSGAMLNYSLMFCGQPTSMSKVKQIVVMGGAIEERGNVPPLNCAEFNVFRCPDSLDAILKFCVPVVLCPLDVTHQVLLTRARLEQEVKKHANSAVMQFLAAASQKFLDFCARHTEHEGCYMHDPLALAIALDPSLVNLVPMRLYVETKPGLTQGLVLRHRRLGKHGPAPPNCRVAMSVQSDKFLDMMFARLTSQSTATSMPSAATTS